MVNTEPSADEPAVLANEPNQRRPSSSPFSLPRSGAELHAASACLCWTVVPHSSKPLLPQALQRTRRPRPLPGQPLSAFRQVGQRTSPLRRTARLTSPENPDSVSPETALVIPQSHSSCWRETPLIQQVDGLLWCCPSSPALERPGGNVLPRHCNCPLSGIQSVPTTFVTDRRR